jgi:hypothetical protein
MRIKVPQNRYQAQPPIEVNKKQSNLNEQLIKHQEQQQQPPPPPSPPIKMAESLLKPDLTPLVVENGQKQKSLKMREQQMGQNLASHRFKLKQKGDGIMSGFEDGENVNNFNDIMNKISMMDLPREYKEEMMV